MTDEILNDIKNTIDINADYKNHYHLHDQFEVEHVDILVTEYEKLKRELEYYKKPMGTKSSLMKFGKKELVDMLVQSFSREHQLQKRADLYSYAIEQVVNYINDAIKCNCMVEDIVNEFQKVLVVLKQGLGDDDSVFKQSDRT